MLSYQHAYHAGNRADVHKHLALVLVLSRLKRKPTPLTFVDANAGRGVYDLDGDEATRTGEAESGIRRLVGRADAPPAVLDYLGVVDALAPSGALSRYPGSPALGLALLGADDRAVLLELHPAEVAALKRWARHDRRVSVHARDCYEGLPALLPPTPRRGLVLIDPSYEVKTEYVQIAELVGRALRRWAQGTYVLWYPLLAEARHRDLLGRLGELGPPATLVSEYRFAGATATEGLRGSGLVIINTPWQLERDLEGAMAWVAGALGGDEPGAYEQRWL